MLSFRAEAECRIQFFSNYYLECLEFRQISGIRLFQFEFAVISMIRYTNVVLCNSVIEELSFHCVNAIVRNYLSCSRFQQLVNFSL